ncbi:MAG: mucoidy inhibitor MuiA family protein [Polyangiales bacterium]
MTDALEPVAVASAATRVTFFEDRAEVQRVARAEVPAGVSWVRVAGASVALDDPSLVASVAGDRARVIGARVVRRVREVPAASAAEVESFERDHRAADRKRAEADASLQRAEAAWQRVRALQAAWVEAVQKVPAGGDDPTAASARWRAAWDALDGRAVACLDGRRDAGTGLDDARDDLARAALRLAEGRRAHPRYEAVVEVQVEAREAHACEVTLVYRTPCALWRPEHLCRLVRRDDGAHELVVRTWATAWQATGEDWSAVPCRFSTARPAQSASAPLLTDDVLRARRKSDAERRTVTVEAREQTVALAGVAGARAVDEMPGVDDGGEPLWFDAPRPATVPSDGAPVRVELFEARMPCEVDRVAFPERAAAVHLRATATLSAPAPLLAGPVVVARGGEVVGRGRVGYVGRGEPFELGFGVDDGLRVRRHVEEKREVTTVMGAQKIARTVTVYVSNLGAEARRLTVTERVPVSEVRDVEVAVVSAGGARHDAKDGFLRWDVEVPAHGTHEASLAYRVEAPAKVALPL